MKSDLTGLPDGDKCLISKAAAFFAPDYALNMSISEWCSSQKEHKNVAKILKSIEDDQLMKYKSRWEDDEAI